MDYIRTPYRRKARLFLDSDQEVTLSWYPAPAGAEFFPYPSTLRSRDRADDLPPWPRMGEIQEAPRRWATGEVHRQYLGKCFVGKPEWYDTGVPIAEAQAPPPLPDCCSPTKQLGGLLLGGTGHVATGNNAKLGGLAWGGTAPHTSGQAPRQVGGLAFSGTAPVTTGRRIMEGGGLRWAGAALVLHGRGGWGVLRGGMGPGGWLLAGFDPPLQGGVSLAGEVVEITEADADAAGGLSWGGSADVATFPNNDMHGGLTWTGEASVKTYQQQALLLPVCSNRIPQLLRGVIDQCTGSLTALAGVRTFGWTTGAVWTCPVPGIGNGQLLLTLDLSGASLSLAKLKCNCFMGTQQTPLNAACYPFRVEWSVSVGGSQLLCTIPQVFSSFHLVVTPFPP